MQSTIEISMYPLSQDYEVQVIEFLKRLNQEKSVRVKTNGVSTQIFGDYLICMNLINRCILEVFESPNKAVFNLKILAGNLDSFDSSLLK